MALCQKPARLICYPLAGMSIRMKFLDILLPLENRILITL